MRDFHGVGFFLFLWWWFYLFVFFCLVVVFCYLNSQPLYSLQHSRWGQLHQGPATPESVLWKHCSKVPHHPNRRKVKSARPLALQSLRRMPKQHLAVTGNWDSPWETSRGRKSEHPQIFRKSVLPPLQFKRLSFGHLYFYGYKDYIESLQFK